MIYSNKIANYKKMRKKQEQIKKLRKKGNKHMKDGKLDKAIEVFLES